jgi:hypothetical protein
MAIKYLNSINLSKNELQNARIQNLASAPSSPVEGQIYYHSDVAAPDLDNRIYFWNGSEWVDMSGGITTITGSTEINVSMSSDGDTATLTINSGSVTNAMLVNSSLTVTAGSGLTGGGSISLGGSATVNVGAGTGIDVTADAVSLKNHAALTANRLLLWDDSNGQVSDSIVHQLGTAIGINTTAPEAELHIVGASNSIGNLLIETDSAGTADADYATLRFRVADNESGYQKFAIIGENTGDNFGRGALHFALDNTADGSSALIEDARMTILSDGKVGIGTQTPSVALHVVGAGYFSGNVEIDGNLTVDGTVTYVNSNTVEIGDNIILLNRDEAGTPSQDAGFEVERGTSSNVSFLWNETNDYWTTVDQKMHIGSIATVTSMSSRNVVVEESGVIQKITASDLVTPVVQGNEHAATIGDGSNTSYAIAHNMGTRDVIVQVYDLSTYETVFTDVTRTDVNTVTVVFATAPSLNSYRVLIKAFA